MLEGKHRTGKVDHVVRYTLTTLLFQTGEWTLGDEIAKGIPTRHFVHNYYDVISVQEKIIWSGEIKPDNSKSHGV